MLFMQKGNYVNQAKEHYEATTAKSFKGNSMVLELVNNAIDMKTLVVMAAWQYAGAGLIANYFSIASALFFAFLIPVWLPLLLMLCLKFVGGFLVRCVLNTLYRKDFA
jgi:hypothetical protein